MIRGVLRALSLGAARSAAMPLSFVSWVRWTRGISVGLVALAMCLVGCQERYGQDSPEQTIATARMLVEKGEARKLGNLIYADNEEMRKLLNRVGVFMGNIEKLSVSIGEKFPDEMAALKIRTEAAAKQGKTTSLVAQLTQSMSGGRGRRNRAKQGFEQRKQAEVVFNDAVKRLFANPYGWLRESEARMTTAFLTDDTSAVLWDGKAIMPPIGLVMKQDADKWFFVLPTNIPGLSAYMPKTKDEFFMWGMMVNTFDSVVVDLTKDIESGSLTTLEGVAQRAGEKAFIPAAMIFMSVANYKEAKAKEIKEAAAAPIEVSAPK